MYKLIIMVPEGSGEGMPPAVIDVAAANESDDGQVLTIARSERNVPLNWGTLQKWMSLVRDMNKNRSGG